jgi:hypothetical protein
MPHGVDLLLILIDMLYHIHIKHRLILCKLTKKVKKALNFFIFLMSTPAKRVKIEIPASEADTIPIWKQVALVGTELANLKKVFLFFFFEVNEFFFKKILLNL